MTFKVFFGCQGMVTSALLNGTDFFKILKQHYARKVHDMYYLIWPSGLGGEAI